MGGSGEACVIAAHSLFLVAVVHMNDLTSPVNVGNVAFMESLPRVWQELQADESVRAIVFFSEKPGNFIAGADIAMLARCKTEQEASKLSSAGQQMLDQIEASSKPVVAAINGSCMGLGAELALACHYRMVTDSPKTILAVPEVQLGILPGAGGCQRLPRLIGLPGALEMALTGANIRADKAKRMGLVDDVIKSLGPGLDTPEKNTANYLRSVAVNKARELAQNGGPRRIMRKPLSFTTKFLTFNAVGRAIALGQAAKQVQSTTRGNYPAPEAILSVIKTGLTQGKEAGLVAEHRAFGQLARTPESEALMSIFFATQSLKKNRFGTPSRECKTVGVVGAGLMGAGIADVSLNKAKLDVLLKDATLPGVQRGEAQIVGSLSKAVQRKQLSQLEKEVRLGRLSSGITYRGFDKADLVIEAVFEDLDVKHRVIAELEAVVPNHCVIATNTSALPIASVAKGAKRPENIVGMHYFSPVDKMPLLEVITHPGTSKEASAQAVHIGLKQGKTVIVVKDGPGFYTTRILMPFVAEAFALLSQGVSVTHIDDVLKQRGFPVGPCTLTDEVGLDVGLHIAKYLKSVWPQRFAGQELEALEEFVAAGFKVSFRCCPCVSQRSFQGTQIGKRIFPVSSAGAAAVVCGQAAGTQRQAAQSRRTSHSQAPPAQRRVSH
jgi:enoyl-CoA hydratase/long-chain 3-hydroxyacyl-CoA dehydrogenase